MLIAWRSVPRDRSRWSLDARAGAHFRLIALAERGVVEHLSGRTASTSNQALLLPVSRWNTSDYLIGPPADLITLLLHSVAFGSSILCWPLIIETTPAKTSGRLFRP